MIMEELEDVDKAIEFAKDQDDAELWEDLISYSIDKPRMILSPNDPVIFFILSFFLIFPLFHNTSLSLSVCFCLPSIHHRPPE